MKKAFILFFVLLCSIGIYARPIGVDRAKDLGLAFVNANLNQACQLTDLQLVYTGTTSRGENSFYVFNFGNTGFVIISADDNYRPIVGYSDEGIFETENMSPELAYYLNSIAEGRSQANRTAQSAEVAEEWMMLKECGKLPSRNRGKKATYLVETRWNQSEPYNWFCPPASGGSGGRAYAGCVATAMSQVMKYWNHPAKGSGSHSYFYNGETLSANFGETTYDWDNMPLTITLSSPQEKIDAVAYFMYHCGIAVDMMYSGSGSGAYSEDVPDAVLMYFGYSNKARLRKRDSYSLEEWQAMLKDSFDQGWPVYYSGNSSDAGHAFVCDGYDDNDLFHFNWGWGGSSNGWFVVDEIDYNSGADAIFNYVPAEVFDNTPKVINDFNAVPNGDDAFTATLTWTNPSLTLNGDAIDTLSQVVIMRDENVVKVFEDLVPGEAMTYIDPVGAPILVNYTIYAVYKGKWGKKAYYNDVNLGPTCPWTVTTTSQGEGWTDGALTMYNSAGIMFAKIAPERGEESAFDVDMAMGRVRFVWSAPTEPVGLSFVINDSEDNVIFKYEGSSADMPVGTFFIANNACGETSEIVNLPSDLVAETDGEDIKLSWTGVADPGYGYNIYRDGLLYSMVADGTTFIDRNAASEGHCYHLTLFTETGESDATESACAMAEGECLAPKNFTYERLENGRFKFSWDAAEGENLSGYRIYRKELGEEYRLVKSLTATSFTETGNSILGKVYYYKVHAIYQSTQCESDFATVLGHPEWRELEINRTMVPMHLKANYNEADELLLEWQPAYAADAYNIYCGNELIASEVTETNYLITLDSEVGGAMYYVTGVQGEVESSPSNKVYYGNYGIESHLNDILEVFPNPANETATVAAPGLNTVTLYNVLGQEVLTAVATDGLCNLNLSGLQKGIYLIKANTSMGNSIQKLILK
jgi:hypothetical protein